jgi:HEAT repeat protein
VSSERRLEVAIAGHSGDVELARTRLDDHDASVRETAVGALARLGALDHTILTRLAGDPDMRVRRRVAEVAATLPGFDLSVLLDDADSRVIETAAWACGEHETVSDEVLDRLLRHATSHDDALVREAAVAALGAIGDERGLPAILHGCRDKPAIRRRAVLALAPFDGPEVDAALAAARDDRDWQVRQSAEDVSG